MDNLEQKESLIHSLKQQLTTLAEVLEQSHNQSTPNKTTNKNTHTTTTSLQLAHSQLII